jgi:UDP-N-acetylmuramoylalanine--D-glutamate ligase
MQLKDLTNLEKPKKILILGLGTENLQFIDWLKKALNFDTKQIILADQKETLPSQTQAENYDKIYLGKNYLEALKNEAVEYVFKAPGIWSLLPELEIFRQKKGSDKITSSLIFFFQKFKNQIIGVTGTKGKSTTSTLINHILNQEKDLISNYCGNTSGISPYKFWTKKDQQISENQFFVIEVSSFQLQDLGYNKISPKYAVISNYFIDHLDQHKNKEEYWQSKDQIFAHQSAADTTIVNQQIESKSKLLKNFPQALIISQENINAFENKIKTPLLGQHNFCNTILACLACSSIFNKINNKKVSIEEILNNSSFYNTALSNYKALSHRLELIRVLNYKNILIKFFDDGFATEPDAVAAAIETLTKAENEFLWLQLSGKDKGPSLESLTATIKTHQNKIFQIDYCGEVGQRIYTEIFKKTKHTQTLKQTSQNIKASLKESLEKFIKENQPEKNLILNICLSPAGSSFDEFTNATQRSNWWADWVKNLSL